MQDLLQEVKLSLQDEKNKAETGVRMMVNMSEEGKLIVLDKAYSSVEKLDNLSEICGALVACLNNHSSLQWICMAYGDGQLPDFSIACKAYIHAFIGKLQFVMIAG